MRLDGVLTELGLTNATAALAPEWELSQAAIPEGDLWFLAPEFVRGACAELGAPEQVAQAAVRVAERMAASESLCALAWHLRYRLYQT